MISKQDIIKAIQNTAQENGGRPLGRERFEKETGIKIYDWMKFWAKFGDVQKEAGFKPNILTVAYDLDYILGKWTNLIKELGRFPTSGDLMVKNHSDPNFPSKGAMLKLGNKQEIVQGVLDYAQRNNLTDVASVCEQAIKISETKINENTNEKLNIGAVYLFRHGKYYKIGKTYDTVRRGNELRIQLPENLDLIHEIKTDDPSGIEAYWHRRFETKRMNGEWFDLTSADLKAFKRWRKIV